MLRINDKRLKQMRRLVRKLHWYVAGKKTYGVENSRVQQYAKAEFILSQTWNGLNSRPKPSGLICPE